MVAPGYWKYNYGELRSVVPEKLHYHTGITGEPGGDGRLHESPKPWRDETGRMLRFYFWAGGVAGLGAGCVLVGCDLTPCSTELGPLCLVA